MDSFMQLWNDYEGRTIADTFPLNKLLAPEGRSAFFSTTNGTGRPAVIRLIEAHFDEAEILDRWRQVAEIKQPNLVTLKKYGQTVVDGTPLVYALLEDTDANLGDVLQDRPLTVEETSQIATSLIAALQALHGRNLVHEHIEPANIFAVGEVIKLRSDCIREAPEGQEGLDLKARDVHDLATVLLQSLTQQRTLPSGTALPPPFNQIIPNGISGTWNLSQIATALAPRAASPAPPTAPTPTAAAPTPKPIASLPTALPSPAPEPTPPVVPLVRDRIVRPVEPEPSRRLGLWIASVIGALLLLFLGWHFLHAAPASTSTDSQPIPTLATAGRDDATSAPPPPVAAAATATTPSAAPAPSSDTRSQWRVVAYTYNHQDQAQQKADVIARQHPDLNPEVFTPTGHAPFLVTVGGPMSRIQANAFKKKAHADGLPRDIYTQNYTR
jgi:eukaryotic-like serine/threonine-protein kinase